MVTPYIVQAQSLDKGYMTSAARGSDAGMRIGARMASPRDDRRSLAFIKTDGCAGWPSVRHVDRLHCNRNRIARGEGLFQGFIEEIVDMRRSGSICSERPTLRIHHYPSGVAATQRLAVDSQFHQEVSLDVLTIFIPAIVIVRVRLIRVSGQEAVSRPFGHRRPAHTIASPARRHSQPCPASRSE